MHTVFRSLRHLIWIAVFALLIATLAVFIYGLISTIVIVFDTFSHGHFGAEGARALSVELIEMIDLFLLGTILFITAIGLQELFIDPSLKELIPKWMSVASLDQLKFNLLAVIVVMLAVLFLGVAASYELTDDVNIFDYGVAVALVIVASGATVYLFARVHRESHASEEQQTKATGEVKAHSHKV